HSLNPRRDGAVLALLHLNGYKISGPTVLGRSTTEEVKALLFGQGYEPVIVEGDEPSIMHRQFAATLEECWSKIRAIQEDARAKGPARRPRWPAIVFKTPKGWTGPKFVDGGPVEGTFRAHQGPLPNVKSNPEHLRPLAKWMKRYRREEVVDGQGRFVDSLAALAPKGDRRMGSNPHANGGRLCVPLDMPVFEDYALPVVQPGTDRAESTRQLGKMLRDVF